MRNFKFVTSYRENLTYCFRISIPFVKILENHVEIDVNPWKNDAIKMKVNLNKRLIYFLNKNTKLLQTYLFKIFNMCSEILKKTSHVNSCFSGFIRKFVNIFKFSFQRWNFLSPGQNIMHIIRVCWALMV